MNNKSNVHAVMELLVVTPIIIVFIIVFFRIMRLILMGEN